MYLFYCLLLLVFVYLVPALACFPKLCLSSRTLFAVPVLSAGIVYLSVTLLQSLNIYTFQTVWILSIIFGCIAVLRLYQLKNENWQWQKWDRLAWLFLICLMLPYFVKLGTEGFERGDEIYSWNFWALQHLYMEPLDFSHTSATYPQLFPKLLSYCYLLLGDIQLQCPVKAMLGMFSVSLLGAWASMLSPFNPRRVVVYLGVSFYVVAGLKLEQFFNDGYADPIMSSAMVCSIALALMATLFSRTNKQSMQLLILSVLSAFIACATKQPAFLWCAVVLPIFLIWEGFYTSQKKMYGLAAVSIALAVLWLLTEGSQFYNNEGVVYLSFEGRGWVEQLIHVFNRYLIKNPLLLIFFIATGFLLKSRQTRLIFYGLLIPQTLLWLMFGAYQLRLGQHIIAASALLCCLELRDIHLPARLAWTARFIQLHTKSISSGFVALSFIACTVLFFKAYWFEKPYLDFKNGGRVSLERYFKADAQKVYDEIYLNSEALLWVPTRYIYGIFYRHTHLTTPDYFRYQPYTMEGLAEELRNKMPDYVFTVSEEIIDGPASRTLSQLIIKCPESFKVFATPPNKFNYTTYKIDKENLKSDVCLDGLSDHIG